MQEGEPIFNFTLSGIKIKYFIITHLGSSLFNCVMKDHLKVTSEGLSGVLVLSNRI